jgi:hypothetical protein
MIALSRFEADGHVAAGFGEFCRCGRRLDVFLWDDPHGGPFWTCRAADAATRDALRVRIREAFSPAPLRRSSG